MKRKRIGNDFNIAWAIMKEDGSPFDLSNGRVSLYLKNYVRKEEVKGFSVEGNVISWTFLGKNQRNTGNHSLEMVINEGADGMITTDACDFVCLVPCSCMEGGEDDAGVKTETLNLTSVITLGGGSYDDTEIKEAIAELDKTKQDTIEDLEAIREGSAKGATAIQSVKTINGKSILGSGDIVIKGGEGGTSVEEIYIGETEPTNNNVKVWINPNEQGESAGNGAGGASSENVEFVNVYLPDAVAEMVMFFYDESNLVFTSDVADMVIETIAEEDANLAIKAQDAYNTLFLKNAKAYNKIIENISLQKDTIVIVNNSLTTSFLVDSVFSDLVGATYHGEEYSSIGIIERGCQVGQANGIPFYIRTEIDFEQRRIHIDEQGNIFFGTSLRTLYYPYGNSELIDEYKEKNSIVLQSLLAKEFRVSEVGLVWIDSGKDVIQMGSSVVCDAQITDSAQAYTAYCIDDFGHYNKVTITLNDDGASTTNVQNLFRLSAI